MNDAPVIVGTWTCREITVGGEPLNPSESPAVAQHSPDGFAWGTAARHKRMVDRECGC